ncbi:MAG: hypothetical protein P8Z71_09455 [Candidatus Sulfobium sp.]
MNTAITPRRGVHLKMPPEMKKEARKPIIPFARRLGPIITEDTLSSTAPMRPPASRPRPSP